MKNHAGVRLIQMLANGDYECALVLDAIDSFPDNSASRATEFLISLAISCSTHDDEAIRAKIIKNIAHEVAKAHLIPACKFLKQHLEKMRDNAYRTIKASNADMSSSEVVICAFVWDFSTKILDRVATLELAVSAKTAMGLKAQNIPGNTAAIPAPKEEATSNI